MDFRHEWKIEINAADHLAIRQRLRFIAEPDPHAKDGRYFIRSLYFDDPTDRALREKLDGVNRREKFRIRYYNGDTSLLHLEKKSKRDGLCRKESSVITAAQAQALVDGELAWMMGSDVPLVQELYCKMRAQGLRPKTIVDYLREPFVYGPGNVRVTFDYDIRTGLSCTDFLNPGCATVPAGDALILMEVKWDAFLPDIIRDAIQTPGRRAAAFSKYARCRIYG
ncbi:MAG: polyphosphate polymerase domain-containing protein [Roseburia sp.]|nr:polyphosphate polymerase domain-containing protein [Roseburia sp.]MCM1098876.1 polyphosphate polymerase domain-containing protein [Ruminococcus flavefaciens]